MSLSLRTRVLLLVAAVNVALFVAAGAYLGDRFQRANDDLGQYLLEKFDLLAAGVGENVAPGADRLNVTPILRWDTWSVLDDAVVVDKHLERDSDGRVVSRGIFLNPVGSSRRGAEFDREAVLGALLGAMEGQLPVPVEGGRAVPILKDGETWGGCWFRLQPPVDPLGMYQNLVPLFLLSTLVLTAGTVLLLRRVVVEPVERLVEGARRVGAGDFDVRLTEPRHQGEIAVLVRAFNEMTATVQHFQLRLEDDVRIATEKARVAEAAAMTQRRLAAMGELAAGIAHEINNPLGGLENAVETLARGDVTDERRERYLALLRDGLERIGHTVARLRRFTPREAAHERVDLTDVATDSLALMRHRAERLGVRVDAQLPDGGLVVEGARNELGQALLNLLGNALDAFEEGGTEDPDGKRVTLSVEPRGDGALVVVDDNGPGVTPEVLARASDLFFTTKEVGRGTGLGLALVHQTVRAHGGRVRLRSVANEGFRVELELPATRPVGGGEDDR